MESGGGAPQQLQGEAVAVFREGITLTLSRWSALQMAVENEWGGRDSCRKAELLVSDILSWFTQSQEPRYIDDLENILDEAMISLNTMTEDGSIEEVAENLMIMHGECLEGNYQSVEKLRVATPQTAHSHIRQAVNDDEDDSDSDIDDNDSVGNDGSSDMMVDVPKPHSNSAEGVAQADDDGWVVVSSKRNRGRRN